MNDRLSEKIANSLKSQILHNKLRPGDMISEKMLTEHYHVSRTPVRQALQHLQTLNLVEIRDGIGSFVTLLAEKDMDDAYQLRCALEKLAIQTSIKNIMPADLSRLEGQFERFKKQLEQGGYGVSLEELTRADWELHDLIINKSDNCLLASAIERATLLLRRYQYTYISSYSKATCEHLDIIHGIMEKDVEKVTDILDKHLRYRPL